MFCDMKRVIVISTSLRHGSNSDMLADQFVEGAKDAGNEVEKITLAGKNIQFCKGCLSMFMNVLWFFVGGIWICLTHIFYGLLLCITIIGIPWGKMHFRLAKLALLPFGMEVV